MSSPSPALTARLRAMREWFEIAKPVPQMTEKRCEQLVEALRAAEDALLVTAESVERPPEAS